MALCIVPCRVLGAMGRKPIKCYVPKELEPYIATIRKELGLSDSEIFRWGVIELMKQLGLFYKVHDRKMSTSDSGTVPQLARNC